MYNHNNSVDCEKIQCKLIFYFSKANLSLTLDSKNLLEKQKLVRKLKSKYLILKIEVIVF